MRAPLSGFCNSRLLPLGTSLGVFSHSEVRGLGTYSPAQPRPETKERAAWVREPESGRPPPRDSPCVGPGAGGPREPLLLRTPRFDPLVGPEVDLFYGPVCERGLAPSITGSARDHRSRRCQVTPQPARAPSPGYRRPDVGRGDGAGRRQAGGDRGPGKAARE